MKKRILKKRKFFILNGFIPRPMNYHTSCVFTVVFTVVFTACSMCVHCVFTANEFWAPSSSSSVCRGRRPSSSFVGRSVDPFVGRRRRRRRPSLVVRRRVRIYCPCTVPCTVLQGSWRSNPWSWIRGGPRWSRGPSGPGAWVLTVHDSSRTVHAQFTPQFSRQFTPAINKAGCKFLIF